jgi:hypothetical protein
VGRTVWTSDRCPPPRLPDLGDRVTLAEVDRDGADVLGLHQPLGHAVHDEHPLGAPDEGGVGGHQADRPGAVHRDGLPRRHLGQVAAVVAGGEDVGEQDEVGLVLAAGGSLRQLKSA